jgi:cytosine/adenosine deaminase-related metal-dependent hydrolase
LTTSIYVDQLINPGDEIEKGVQLKIDDERITSIKTDRVASHEDIKLPNAVCSPALINAHDHLKFTWPEHIGTPPYSNSYDWRPILHRESRKNFREVDLEDLYWLGTYKNVLSGVSTVANQSRRLPRSFFSRFPVRILFDFAREIFIHADPRAHEVGLGARGEAKVAIAEGIPFVIHVAEGVDERTARELKELDAMGGLFEDSVLVHGVNLSEKDVDRISEAHASVVWCPGSNLFLFNKTAPIELLLKRGINVALGTDSTCSGSPSLVHEMRIAINELDPSLSKRAAAQILFSFVTVNAARAYKVSDALGRIKVGGYADLLIFSSDNNDPYSGLLDLQPESIDLLTRAGKWLVGTEVSITALPCAHSTQTKVAIAGTEKHIVGKPHEVLKRVARDCQREPTFFTLGRIVEAFG